MVDEPHHDSASVVLHTSSLPQTNAPPWTAEAIAVLRTWWIRWLPLPLVETVQVSRGRAGRFEVIDFVLVLLTYAVSGAPTLRSFYQQAHPVASVLMALWQRYALPSRSALSRFLKDMSAEAVESLRALFFRSRIQRCVRRDDGRTARSTRATACAVRRRWHPPSRASACAGARP